VAITQPVAAPITVLSMGGGFLFCTRFGTAMGVLLGTACSLTGALSGAVLAFALSRQVTHKIPYNCLLFQSIVSSVV
jgi:uncharacterized membrane protein YdjX (TVP38/TMEM64 family)